MPPTGALSPEQIAVIRDWIDQGAEWPDELANEAASMPQNPQTAKLMDAVRAGDQSLFEALLRKSPASANGKGSGGATPLMYTALYRRPAMTALLLDRGADPNARNDSGAGALLWGIDDAQTTRLLLERGADPDSRSADGLTPLMLAASHFGSTEVLKLLLDHGAKLQGQPVLSRAATAGDEEAVGFLMSRGAETTTLPGDLAIHSGCAECARVMLSLARPADLNRALLASARVGDSGGVQILLERGAAPSSAVLRAAAASEKSPVEAVKALLQRGARDDEALGWATRQGDTAVVTSLREAGFKEIPEKRTPPPAHATGPLSVRAAVEKSLPLLQHADAAFLKKAGCVSCHSNSLTEMTIASARGRGFRVNEEAAKAQLNAIRPYLETWRERVLQDIAIPGGVDTAGYILAGLAAAQYPPDPATDAIAIYLKRHQGHDGGWRIGSQRPPIESSDIEATALALRALQAYGPKARRAEFEDAIARGRKWMSLARPVTNEDYVYQLLGLGWTKGDRQVIQQAAAALSARQRADGGWAQLSSLSSDAYAAGQALASLAQAGGMSARDPVYQRGVRYLLGSQLEDGSWHVASRAIPVQPYFDSEFPHGSDQFISAAATNWAVMAVLHAVR